MCVRKNLAISGSDAVVAILVWAVSLLVNNQHVLRKAQEELDRTIGNQRVVEESDLKDLVYLQAIVKETFRLYPPAPFVAYRETTEDFVIANGNFHIPAGYIFDTVIVFYLFFFLSYNYIKIIIINLFLLFDV